MRNSRLAAAALLFCLCVAAVAQSSDPAQDSQPPKPSAQNADPGYEPLPAPAPPADERDAQPVGPPRTAEPPRTYREARPYAVQDEPRPWTPPALQALAQYANGRTEFTLDHSMLGLASRLDRDREELGRIIAGINAISVHSFHYPGGVSLDPADIAELARQHREAGFVHLVRKHHDESGRVTDLWVRLEGGTIRDIAVFWVTSKDVNFIAVSGAISPLDLVHLGGHMGIPRMDPGAAVAVPDATAPNAPANDRGWR